MLLLEVEIKKEKKLVYELQKVFGLSKKTIINVCGRFGLNIEIVVSNVPSYLLKRIIRYIKSTYKINMVLKNELLESIRLEKRIRSYRGYRRHLKLPLNGQRTKTNGKTVKKLL